MAARTPGTRVTSWLHACFRSACHSIEFPILAWNPIHVHFSKYRGGNEGRINDGNFDIGGWKRWKVDILEIHRLLLKTCWNFYLNSLNSGEIFRGERNAWRKNDDEFWNENGRVKKIKFHIHIKKRDKWLEWCDCVWWLHESNVKYDSINTGYIREYSVIIYQSIQFFLRSRNIIFESRNMIFIWDH